LHVKFKNGSVKFHHKCTNSWFRKNGIGYVLGMH